MKNRPSETQRHRLQALSKTLCDLLFWAEVPESEPLPEGWLAAMREDIDSRIRQIDATEDAELFEKLKLTREHAFHFTSLLHDSASLSTVPVHEWKIQRHIDLFETISKLQSDFEEASKRETSTANLDNNTDESSSVGSLREFSPNSLENRLNNAYHMMRGSTQKPLFETLMDMQVHQIKNLATATQTDEAVSKAAGRIAEKLLNEPSLNLDLDINGSSLLLKDISGQKLDE